MGVKRYLTRGATFWNNYPHFFSMEAEILAIVEDLGGGAACTSEAGGFDRGEHL